MPTTAGHLYLTYTNKRFFELTGLILHFLSGPEPLEDDPSFFGNLRVSGLARAYLENLQRTKRSGEEF